MIDCEPVFAVTSAKFSCNVNDRWMAARDALAAKNDIFLLEALETYKCRFQISPLMMTNRTLIIEILNN